MKYYVSIAFSGLLLLFITACANQTSLVTPDMIQNHQWKLIEIDGMEVSSAATLEINSEAHASGSAGCNRFFGQSELKNGRFRIEKVGMTRMACLDNSQMKTERSVSNILSNWSDLSVKDGQLILKGDSYSLTYIKDI